MALTGPERNFCFAGASQFSAMRTGEFDGVGRRFALTLTHGRRLLFIIAVLTLVAGGVAVLWLFIPPLFWGISGLVVGFIAPIDMYLYISRWRERTLAIWQNNWWGPGLIKLIWQNSWSVLQLLILVGVIARSIDQLTGLAPPDDSLNLWVLIGVIAYSGVAAIFLPRVWSLLYKARLASTPSLRDIVRYSWESRPSSS